MNLNRLQLIEDSEKEGLITREEAVNLINKYVVEKQTERQK